MTVATHSGMMGPSKAEKHPHGTNSDKKKPKRTTQCRSQYGKGTKKKLLNKVATT